MTTLTKESQNPEQPEVLELDRVTIRFAGDSGDGMQLAGTQFTKTSAVVGNDIATFPDIPAEIRAPQGSLPGVSGFQVSFSSTEIYTPGDAPDVLVAMNPAALKTNIGDLPRGGLLIVNEDEFNETNLKKAAYASNPLEDDSLRSYRLYKVPISKLNERALKDSGLTAVQIDRCKNMFALGLTFWMYSRPLDTTIHWINEKFGKNPEVAAANIKTLKAGYAFGETTEMFATHYHVPKAKQAPGLYR
ncbi:MAG TPA: 2-oxoacid:acceptor oxidoreductase family protein, partial [Tepidiformaceae bacterium]|nr:2-oxoacid:acceptor oxidoreductase family protein [Tepidiformaceae bacterium]